MTGLVTGNLALLASSPEGIKKLRAMILEFAIQGKLTSQEADDECATELLSRITLEKARQIASGNHQRRKPARCSAGKNTSAELPIGWAQAFLGELVKISTGKLDANAAVADGKYLFFTCSKTPSRIDAYSYDTDAVLLAGNGDFNIKKYSGKFDAYQRTYVIEPIIWGIDYCFIVFSAKINEITENNRGSAVPYLKLGDIESLPILVPPFAEQTRLVAKVNELMALCDRLEVRQQDAEAAHAKLVQALLDSLTRARDVDEFRAAWQRLAQEFRSLFNTEASIDALEQAILQLAISGRIVDQQCIDEADVKVAHDCAMPKIPVRPLFDLPAHWRWGHLAEVAKVLSGYAFSSECFQSTPGTRVVKITNAGVGNFVETNDFLPGPFSEVHKNFAVRAGDLILALTRPYVSTGLKISKCPVSYDGALLNQRVASIRFSSPVDTEFGFLFLRSPAVLALYKERFGRSGLQPNLKVSDVTTLPIPIAPTEEQHRIVAKVTELLALCDQLKARIAAARAKHAQLAEALVAQALAA